MSRVIKGDFTRKKKNVHLTGSEEKPAPIYQFKISLVFTDPLVWRRIQVPGDTFLERMHNILQSCMGWKDIHAHRFLVGKVFYAPLSSDEIWGSTGERSESEFQLVALEKDMKWCFTYIYDFGDGWEHEIELEEIIPAGKESRHPVLMGGERACPPENVGGVPGFEEFLSIINNPRHEQHKKIAKWYGANRFNQEFIDITGINEALKRV